MSGSLNCVWYYMRLIVPRHSTVLLLLTLRIWPIGTAFNFFCYDAIWAEDIVCISRYRCTIQTLFVCYRFIASFVVGTRCVLFPKLLAVSKTKFTLKWQIKKPYCIRYKLQTISLPRAAWSSLLSIVAGPPCEPMQ